MAILEFTVKNHETNYITSHIYTYGRDKGLTVNDM